MYFIMNIVIANRQKFSASPIYSSYAFQLSSEYVLKQEFKPKYAHKNAIILLKNLKITQRWALRPRLPH